MEFPLKIVAVSLSLAFVFAAPAGAQTSRPVQIFETSAGPVKITPIYHASALIEAAGKTIYIDPAKPGNFSGLPPADLILITDIHGDHMDPATVLALSKAGTQILAPPAVVNTVTAAGSLSNGEKKTGAAGPSKPSLCTTSCAAPQPGSFFTQGPRQRLRPHLWRKALLLFGRHGRHSRNARAQEY